MADPIARLLDEHRRIERVLAALEIWAEGPRTLASGARTTLGAFAGFLRRFADVAHHGKEEATLFRALRDHDALPECGPINLYLLEHSQGRALVSRLFRVAEGRGPISDAERAEIRPVVRTLVDLLRTHIAREDHELFPAVRRALPEEALATLAEAFDEFDRNAFGPGGYDDLTATADRLAEPGGPNTESEHELPTTRT